MKLVLASQSAARRAMLEAAGVPHSTVAARVDEDAIKAGLRSAGAKPRDIADTLAEMKALRSGADAPGILVLGSDSIVLCEDGTILDKPADRDTARAHLTMLSGARHQLISAAVITENGQPVWRHVDRVTLAMRPLSSGFLDAYLDVEWPAIAGCVGCYRIEGHGAQLFEKVEGSLFSVRGVLPS